MNYLYRCSCKLIWKKFYINILKIASNEIFVPITVGGIRSISDAKKLLLSGADKIALNTAALKNPSLIKSLVETFEANAL